MNAYNRDHLFWEQLHDEAPLPENRTYDDGYPYSEYDDETSSPDEYEDEYPPCPFPLYDSC